MTVGILLALLAIHNSHEVTNIGRSSFRVHPAGFYVDSLPPEFFRKGAGNQSSMSLEENPVNDDNLPYSLVRQFQPSLTVDGNGNYIIAWCDRRCGIDDNETYVRAFDYLGAPLRPDYCPNSDEGYRYHVCPNTAADAQGNHVVLWSEYASDAGTNAIARLLDPNGNPLGAPFRVNDAEGTVDYHQDRISVDRNARGEFAVAWEELNGDNIYLQIYDENAQPIGGNIKVNTTNDNTGFPSVCIDENRNSVVVWNYRLWPLPSILYGQRFDADGSPIGVNFVIDNINEHAHFGSVDCRPDGHFSIVWYAATGNDFADIWCKMYDANGVEIRTFLVNDVNQSVDSWPDISVDAAGNFVIVWYYTDESTANHYVHLQRYDNQGLRIGGNVCANEVPLGFYGNRWPTVALGDGGYFMVAWEDYRLYMHANYGDLYGQIYRLNPPQAIGVNVKLNSDINTVYQRCSPTMVPNVISYPGRGFLAAWTDDRDRVSAGNPQVYLQKHDNTGTPVGPNVKVQPPEPNEWMSAPCGAMSASGASVIAYETHVYQNSMICQRIYAQRYSPDGTPVGSSILVDWETSGSGFSGERPAVAMMPTGEFVVAWINRDSWEQTRTYIQRFDAGGSYIGGNTCVSNSCAPVSIDPCITVDKYGDFTVAYMGKLLSQPPADNNYQIIGVRGDVSGNIGQEFRINDDASPPPPPHNERLFLHQKPSIVCLDDGSSWVVWIDDRDRDYYYDIYAQKFDENGNKQGVNFQLTEDLPGVHFVAPFIAATPVGEYLVAWASNQDPDWDAYISRFKKDGSVVTPETRINTTDEPFNCHQSLPRVASNGDLTFLIWEDNRRLMEYDIYGGFIDENFFRLACDKHGTAFNEQPHLARMPNTENLLVVYQSANKVYFSESYDGGVTWELPQMIGNGIYPAIGVTGFGSPCVTYLSPDGQDLIYRYRDPMMMGWLGFTIFDGNFALRPEQASMFIHTTAGDSVRLAFRVIDLNNEYSSIYYADFPWYETNAVSHSQIIDGQPPDYLDRRSPSISADMFDQLHVAWQKADPMTGLGETYYRYRNVLGTWSLDYNVKPSPEPSVYPHCEGYGDSVFIHWSEELSTQNLDVWRAARHVLEFPVTWNYVPIAPSPDSSVFPVCAVGEYSIWSEKTNNSNFEIYYWNRTTNQINNLSETPNRSWFGHSNYYQNIMGDPTLYTCWTESLYADAYEVKFRATGGFDYGNERYVCFYSISVGDSAPSRYTTRRQGRIHWPNRGVWADYDSTALIYKLLCPNPKFLYKVVVVPYQEKGTLWSARLTADNLPIRTVSFSSGTWDTFQFWLPETTYKTDKTVNLRIEKASGEYVPIAYLRVYQFEKKKAAKGEGGYVQGGTQSAETQAVQLRTELKGIAPNPLAKPARINYTLATPSRVSLRIYDPTGRMVRNLVERTMPPGAHACVWQGSDDRGRRLPNGIYFVRMATSDYKATEKVILLQQ